MLTLKQIKNSSVANIASADVNSVQFSNYVSEAVSRLCDLGDWVGSTATMVSQVYIDTQNGVMVWPYFVDAVLAVKENRRLAPPKNYWYEFVPTGGEWARTVTGLMNNYHSNCWPRVVRFSGTTPVLLQPSPANPFAIQATAENAADNGKTVTIYGVDTNGNEVYTTQDGVIQRGVTVTLVTNPITKDDAGGVINFISISHVSKDQTGAEVNLWVYSLTSPYATLVANYAANETSPQYLFSQISGVLQPSWKFIEALVKIKPLPVVNDNDLIPLDNIEAIKSMIQSIKRAEAGDVDGANKFEVEAVRRLIMALNTKYPLEQIEARNLTFSMGVPRSNRRPY